jgi:hypothetical protein
MGAGILPQAVEVAARVRDAQRLRGFEHAAADFVRLLGTVPDCAPHELSETEVTALHRLAEGVIERIETRLDSRVDAPGHQQALASTVYEIRRLLEEVDTWRQHYAAGRVR